MIGKNKGIYYELQVKHVLTSSMHIHQSTQVMPGLEIGTNTVAFVTELVPFATKTSRGVANL